MINNFKIIFIGVIFLIIGFGILIGDYFITKNTIIFIKNSEKTDGIVINLIRKTSDEGGYTYSPEVSYVDGIGKTNSFVSNISSSISTYTVGEKVPVIYNKNNSLEAKINTPFQLWFATGIMSTLGLILFLIGLMIIVNKIEESYLKKSLLLRGTKIFAKVTSVQSPLIRSGVSYGSSIPDKTYQIIAQWLNPRDGKMYVFESDDLFYNPESLILNKEICVYIDLNDPKKYYVDTSTLPKIGN
jgi:hypothetical protein